MTDNNDTELLKNIKRIKGGKMHEAFISEAIAEELLYGILRFVITEDSKGCQRGDKIKFTTRKGSPFTRKLTECVFNIDYVWNGNGLDKGYVGLALTIAETDNEDVLKSWQIGAIADEARAVLNSREAEAAYAKASADKRIQELKSEFEAMGKYRKIAEDKGWHGISGLVFIEKEGVLIDTFKSLQTAAVYLGVEPTMLAGMSMTNRPRIVNGCKVWREPIKWVEPDWTRLHYKLALDYRDEYRRQRQKGIPTI